MLSCASGSPSSCKVTPVDLKGRAYSAGQLVQVTGGLNVSNTTMPNSCPVGMKIFAPQSRRDWEVVCNAEPNPCDRRSVLVDVTKPIGGGDYRKRAMNSESGVPDWTTSDGAPWWLSDTATGEPSGDYTANNFLNVAVKAGTNNAHVWGRCQSIESLFGGGGGGGEGVDGHPWIC